MGDSVQLGLSILLDESLFILKKLEPGEKETRLPAVPPELIQVYPPNVLMQVSLSLQELLTRHSLTSENNKD